MAGYAARYREVKAHESLLHAWEDVIAAFPGAVLACCGDDEETANGSSRNWFANCAWQAT